MQLINNRHSIKEGRAVVSWIYSTATNYCFNFLRSRKKFDQSVACEELTNNPRTEETIDARRIIDLALKEHSTKVRDAVYYTYVENLTQEEIREVTGQSPATIRRNLSRFRESLGSLMKRFGQA